MIGWKTGAVVAGITIHLIVLLRAMLVEGREPQARAAWLLLLLALPGIGTALYVLFGEPWVSKRFRNRVAQASTQLAPFAPKFGLADGTIAPFENPFSTCAAVAGWSAAGGNEAAVAHNSDAAIDMIVADIEGATRAVHISFYIWLGDHNGTKVADAVCRAARRGVTCRIAADAIGSHAFIRSAHWAAMRDAGAHLCATLAVPFGLAFLAGHRLDLRNHRKITVIDGRITYCGSQNCADPAFLPKRRFAPWVDILIRYEGPVAHQADLIFAALWTAETGEDLRAATTVSVSPVHGGLTAIAVGTGPLSPRGAMTDIFAACLASARQRIVITTPYFAPDPPLLAAIVAAARRGVAVTIIFPRRNDSRIVGAISRAYYPVLAKAGVRIFEYRGGLLHAKTLVIDGELALVGSSNMDRRSLDLNFENNILFRSAELAAQVGAHQDRWLADAIEIERGGIAARSPARRLLDNSLTIVGALF
ncbi:MAG: cardiolipin synthase [Sphingomonas sp.]|uniref:cardiolipin synthase n=1 Tax=Sphingomonas sp. TaxID=28214 RepID=UPI0025F39873|nr:cardiolipin synthase [Sphingomonas sp.]MBX3565212.1 cardiolipin synthase [Sphingomonas sp.]